MIGYIAHVSIVDSATIYYSRTVCAPQVPSQTVDGVTFFATDNHNRQLMTGTVPTFQQRTFVVNSDKTSNVKRSKLLHGFVYGCVVIDRVVKAVVTTLLPGIVGCDDLSHCRKGLTRRSECGWPSKRAASSNGEGGRHAAQHGGAVFWGQCGAKS
jgi:hypothetical protein